MGQKVHPLGFRLGITQKHQSYWCTNPRTSALWIDDASFLRRFLQKNYTGAGITHIEIHRRELDCSSISIKIYAARPALFSGRDLKSLDSLRDQLIKKLKAFYRKRNLPDPGNIIISLYIKPITEPDAYAAVLAEKLVEDLQQRKPYRRAMRQIIQNADIARSEELREGPVPLQTLRADIDYSSKSAKTIFGLLGVKIWVFHGERLNPLTNF
jgi:small subunit ribosomal protein S3